MIVKGRHTAAFEGPLAVFVIGMRINRWLAIRKWWPPFMAMPRMLKELAADAESGFLGGELMLRGLRMPVLIQYWRSFEDLDRYALDPAREHRPAWIAFNKAVGGDGSVGIFHETYLVEAGRYESVYANMPPFGLAAVQGVVPATGSRNSARERLGQR
jgi:hypothetical protein